MDFQHIEDIGAEEYIIPIPPPSPPAYVKRNVVAQPPVAVPPTPPPAYSEEGSLVLTEIMPDGNHRWRTNMLNILTTCHLIFLEFIISEEGTMMFTAEGFGRPFAG